MTTINRPVLQVAAEGPGASAHERPAADAAELAGLFKRVGLRLIPFLFLCYVLNYIDRVNISFAQLQFRSDLGLSEASYGLGVGVFYIGYVLFEVPSNLLLGRIGARKTIARIMVLWGLVSMGMMLVQTPGQFYAARIALGIAEAGFFPGIIYYLNSWFPNRYRARVMSLFVLGIAVAGITGGPVSGWILAHAEGWQQLHAWQWLFLIEGLPPVLAGCFAWFYLTDTPRQAHWLSEREKALIGAALDAPAEGQAHKADSFRAALRTPKVYLCAFGYFTITWAGSVLNFWAPSIIRGAGVSNLWHVGLLSAIPYATGAVAMLLISRHSDARQERVLHFSVLALAAAAGAVGVAFQHDAFVPAIACLALLATGYLSCTAIFWTLPSTFLSGTASVGAIALISSVGQLGSLSAPVAIGWLTSITHEISAGSLLAAAVLTSGGLAIALFMRPARAGA
ncbi:MAG: MFS transporter [Burkholderiaceae bacterium]